MDRNRISSIQHILKFMVHFSPNTNACISALFPISNTSMPGRVYTSTPNPSTRLLNPRGMSTSARRASMRSSSAGRYPPLAAPFISMLYARMSGGRPRPRMVANSPRASTSSRTPTHALMPAQPQETVSCCDGQLL